MNFPKLKIETVITTNTSLQFSHHKSMELIEFSIVNKKIVFHFLPLFLKSHKSSIYSICVGLVKQNDVICVISFQQFDFWW